MRAYVLQVSKGTRKLLKTALYCYFCVWCMYSVLWALLQAGA